MNRVVLEENDQLGALIPLTDEQAVAAMASRLLEVRPEPVGWRVLPRMNMVGAIRVDDLEIEVRPKAGFQSLMFMLGFASDPGIRPDDVEASTDTDVWSSVAEWCARLTERALLAGVLQGYQTISESLPLVRGRIDFATQLSTRSHALIPMALQFDEFTADIYENRLLRTALRRASWLPGLRPELRLRLRHLDRRLEMVQTLRSFQPDGWSANRANARYVPAMRFADLLLRGVGLDVPAAGARSFGFAVDLARVFEEFLVAAISESCDGSAVEVRHHPGLHLDEARRLAIAPDIGLFKRRNLVAVLDAKYKLFGPVGDLYQMLAYCTVSHLSRGWLIYAGGRSEAPRAVHHSVAGAEIVITQWPLNPGAAPRELLGQVDVLVSEVLAALTPSPGS